MAAAFSPRHEIPTHLDVEDKAYYGLSARQVTYLVAGFSAGYGWWIENPGLPLAVRGGIVCGCLLLALSLALLRPYGRSLEEWAIVGLRYLAVPRVSVWRAGATRPTPRDRSAEEWLALAPRPDWAREGE